MMYSIAAFVDEIIMIKEALKRYNVESENEDPAYLEQQENPVPPPEPIYDNTIDNNSDKMMMTPDDSDAVKATEAFCLLFLYLYKLRCVPL
jgi:hypothetical protein